MVPTLLQPFKGRLADSCAVEHWQGQAVEEDERNGNASNVSRVQVVISV